MTRHGVGVVNNRDSNRETALAPLLLPGTQSTSPNVSTRQELGMGVQQVSNHNVCTVTTLFRERSTCCVPYQD